MLQRVYMLADRARGDLGIETEPIVLPSSKTASRALAPRRLSVLSAILNWVGGGVIKQFTGPLLAAYQAKLWAQNDADKLAAEQVIVKIEAARDIAVVEAGRAWSAIYLVQIITPPGSASTWSSSVCRRAYTTWRWCLDRYFEKGETRP